MRHLEDPVFDVVPPEGPCTACGSVKVYEAVCVDCGADAGATLPPPAADPLPD